MSPPATATRPSKRTEEQMLELLRRRYVGQGRNGDAWAVITKLRNGTGAGRSPRTLDAAAMSLWPSRGLHLHGFEVKCSRVDWLRELKNPSKAEPFFAFLDRFWLVAADGSIVEDGELPPAWGLLVAKGQRLVCEREAPILEPEPPDRLILAALLRAAVYIGRARPAEVEAAVRDERERLEEHHQRMLELKEDRVETLTELIRSFEEAAGVRLGVGGIGGWASHPPDEIGRALRAVLDGEADLKRFEQRAKRIQESALSLAEDAGKLIGSSA